jgi:hypothetical protein
MYISRTDKPIRTEHGILIPFRKEEKTWGSIDGESTQNLFPGEGGFRKLETEHDIETAPSPHLFTPKDRRKAVLNLKKNFRKPSPSSTWGIWCGSANQPTKQKAN